VVEDVFVVVENVVDVDVVIVVFKGIQLRPSFVAL